MAAGGATVSPEPSPRALAPCQRSDTGAVAREAKSPIFLPDFRPPTRSLVAVHRTPRWCTSSSTAAERVAIQGDRCEEFAICRQRLESHGSIVGRTKRRRDAWLGRGSH